jgi:cell division protein DivIC
VNARRILTTVYIVLLAAIGITAGQILTDARKEYLELKQTEAVNEARLAEAQARLADQKKVLERLRNDPAFAEKVIRQRMGYARPGEVIFRFP